MSKCLSLETPSTTLVCTLMNHFLSITSVQYFPHLCQVYPGPDMPLDTAQVVVILVEKVVVGSAV